MKIFVLISLIFLSSCDFKKKEIIETNYHVNTDSINYEELEANLEGYLNSNKRDSLKSFFKNWKEAIEAHTINIQLHSKVRINSYEIYTQFFTDIDTTSKYCLVQNKLKYLVKSSRRISLVDCIKNNMDSLLYFRPNLTLNTPFEYLYLSKEYESAINKILKKTNSLTDQVKYQKNELLNQFIQVHLNEVDDNCHINRSFYISYIVFNRDYNRAIIKYWSYDYSSETWLLVKKNGKWRKEKLLEQLVI